VWPPHSPDLTHLNSFLWGYVKSKVNTMDEFKACITSAIADATGDISQRVWREVDCR
jgi:hypothetical protein